MFSRMEAVKYKFFLILVFNFNPSIISKNNIFKSNNSFHRNSKIIKTFQVVWDLLVAALI